MPDFFGLNFFFRFCETVVITLKRKVMVKTLGQQLEAVQTAIEAVETSQSYKIDGKELTRANLKDLYNRENNLISKIDILGSSYIPGQNQKPMKMYAPVQFN